MPCAPTPFRPLREDVRDRIRERIIGGHHAPGSRLVERTIADELGVSRIPVREALQALVIEGFAVERDTRGIAVRTYDARQIAELAEVGAALERILIGSLAAAIDEDGLSRLRCVLNEGQTAIEGGDTSGAVQANGRFHDVLASLGKGTIAHEALAPVAGRRRWLMSRHTDPAPIHAEHVQMVDAIAAGDSVRAQQLAQRHAATTIAHALSTEVRR